MIEEHTGAPAVSAVRALFALAACEGLTVRIDRDGTGWACSLSGGSWWYLGAPHRTVEEAAAHTINEASAELALIWGAEDA